MRPGGADRSPGYIRVSKIVQATQWPAVTTGTIICTSGTRPASPFAGQQIYETDTSRLLVYSGSAWVVIRGPVNFQAFLNGVAGTSGGATLPFSRINTNTGSAYNSGTYTFTAPYAGDYWFRTQVQGRSVNPLQMFWNINGSTTNNRGVYCSVAGDSVGSNMELIRTCAAGDTVSVYYSLAAGDIYGGTAEYFSYFMGHSL